MLISPLPFLTSPLLYRIVDPVLLCSPKWLCSQSWCQTCTHFWRLVLQACLAGALCGLPFLFNSSTKPHMRARVRGLE